MNTTTYVHLALGESIVGEFDPPPVGALNPQARIHLGRVYDEQKLTLTFDSLAQVVALRDELSALWDQWRAYLHAQRMTDMAEAREQAAS